MRRLILLFGLVLLASSCIMSAPLADDEAAAASDTVDAGAAELTEPLQAFLEIMAQREPISRTQTGAEGVVFNLEHGSLCVLDADGAELWRTGKDWWIDDFRLGDVDGDGAEDIVFSLWKSYRFGKAHPSRMKNDDESVRNHLFIYTVHAGHVQAVWGSSDLPGPIYGFELDPTGRVTTVHSGMLLRTEEGEYRDDFSHTTPVQRVYAWEGWGFVPLPSDLGLH